MKKAKVILIHGYTSSPKRTKYEIIARELEKLGVDYAIPEFPGGEHPHSEEWLKIIHEEVSGSGVPVILVGHSLGTRAALLYLDKYEQPVGAVILFFAFNNNAARNVERRDGNYADFFVKTDNKTVYVVETKGREDLDDPLKIDRLKQWCTDANDRQKKITYKMLYVKQEEWEKYRPKSFKELIGLVSG